ALNSKGETYTYIVTVAAAVPLEPYRPSTATQALL
ncbi:MAG: hypothetical protein ACJAYU_002050, partial [Bradymonadia bacterium]